MLTKETVKERPQEAVLLFLEEEPNLGKRVEASIGQSLAAQVEKSIGTNLGETVEETIPRNQESRVEITAADLLRYLMIPGTCMGFRQLEMVINLAVEDENRLLNVVENLYPLVGKAYGSSANSVQKNMRVAILAGWRNGGGEQLAKLTGLPARSRPVTKDFIDLLADYLRRRIAK